MPNLIQKGLKHLSQSMEKHASVRVCYERPGEGRIDWIPAVIGESRFELTDSSDSVISVVSRDFIIRQSRLVLLTGGTVVDYGDRTRPKRGDLIWQMIQGVKRTFIVMPDAGIPPYRTTDGYELTYRIHTKLLEE